MIAEHVGSSLRRERFYINFRNSFLKEGSLLKLLPFNSQSETASLDRFPFQSTQILNRSVGPAEGGGGAELRPVCPRRVGKSRHSSHCAPVKSKSDLT